MNPQIIEVTTETWAFTGAVSGAAKSFAPGVIILKPFELAEAAVPVVDIEPGEPDSPFGLEE